jgi:hypothetical protein
LDPSERRDLEHLSIVETNNYIATDESWTRRHGVLTTRIISRVASDSKYYFYRIIAHDREFRVHNFLKAMKNAQADDLDIINISAGASHKDCGGNCRPCTAARQLLDDETVIVAGAGNTMGDNKKSLFCPAYVDQVIAVGAFHTFCTYEIKNKNQSFPFRPTSIDHPASCYYLEDDESRPCGELYGEQMCGQRGCTAGTPCSNFQKERLWSGNVDFSKKRPDVFAPSHVAVVTEDNVEYDEGTSFSTAYVTGSLAAIFAELERKTELPSPREVNTGLTMIDETVGDSSWRKYDARTLFEFLSR